MPVLDGFEATRRIRQAEKLGILHGHLPIIALTANVSTDSRERCIEAGADHFLAKPLNLSELHECIKRFV
jgi:CheY-like chemotaxis protein